MAAADNKPKHNFMKEPDNAPYGVTFLGRDIDSWGESGTGLIPIDPNICVEDPEDDTGKPLCPEYNDVIGSDNDINHKIHLVIASYRDRLCPRTLYNIFTKSENPSRIFIRIIQQLDPTSNLVDDLDCWDMLCTTYNTKKSVEGEDGEEGGNGGEGNDYDNTSKPEFDCNKYKHQVDIVSYDSRVAKGPCDARSKLSSLIQYDYIHRNDNQARLSGVDVKDYCMQTDSHMDFAQDFDTKLIQMFHRATNDRAVLSTYVAPIEQTNLDPKEVPNLCMITYTSTWRNWGTKFLRRATKPKLTNLVWGAGMSFQKCHGELNVPYDPYLDGVFDGEETSRGIRFFTHGYDVYTPDKVLVTHDYHGHQGNPVVHTWGRKNNPNDNGVTSGTGFDLLDKVDWSFMNVINGIRSKYKISPIGTRRLNILMGTTKPKDKDEALAVVDGGGGDEPSSVTELIQNGMYGLGTVRTLDQAYEFSGFDPINHKMLKNNCGNLKWVPYKPLRRDDEDDSYDFGVSKTLNRKIWTETQDDVLQFLSNTNNYSKKQAAVGGGGGGGDGGGMESLSPLAPVSHKIQPIEGAAAAPQVITNDKIGGGSAGSNNAIPINNVNINKIRRMEDQLQRTTSSYTNGTMGFAYLLVIVLIFVLRTTHGSVLCKKQKLKSPKSN